MVLEKLIRSLNSVLYCYQNMHIRSKCTQAVLHHIVFLLVIYDI